MNLKGKFIVLEGSDFAGKSTLISELEKTLNRLEPNLKVYITKEPTNGPYGQDFRRLLFENKNFTTEEQIKLLLCDRKDHQQRIHESILRDYLVITDRYYLSNLAYQDFNYEHLKILNSSLNGILQPDLVFLLEAHIDVILERMQGREKLDGFENKNKILQVKAKYELILKDNWTYPIKKIDTSGELDKSLQTVVEYLESLFP